MKKAKTMLFWTLCYALFAALFFYVLFNFKIWAAVHWDKMARTTIRGLSGLAFGASLIAIVPIYLASIKYIWTNNKFPIPSPIKKTKKPDEDEEEAEPDDGPKHSFPENLPDELKEPFIRFYSGTLARNAIEFIQHMDGPTPTVDAVSAGAPSAKQVETAPDAFMPVPDSFDAPSRSDADTDAPVFSDVNFETDDNSDAIEIREENGKKIASYVFDDSDFWVADDKENWFAAGKQIKSPIKLLLAADADERELVLKTKNIMNLEKLIPEWEKTGITIKY